MEREILSVIAEASGRFSKGQRQIADFIVKNYEKAAFMNAVKLGEAVGVSESTVVRFAFMLGYEGYPSMRRAVQEMIRNRLTSVQRIEVSRGILGKDDALTSILSSDMERIQGTLEAVDKQAFENAVNTMLGAKKIYLLGLRASAVLSSFMGFYLNMIFENVRVVSDAYTNETFEQIINIGDGDVLVAISFPRYSRRTVRAVRYAKDRGVATIAITDDGLSPIAEIADIRILAKSDMVSFVDSLVAPLSVINALVAALGNRKEDKLSERFEKLESIWSEYDVYEKNPEV